MQGFALFEANQYHTEHVEREDEEKCGQIVPITHGIVLRRKQPGCGNEYKYRDDHDRPALFSSRRPAVTPAFLLKPIFLRYYSPLFVKFSAQELIQ